MEINDEIYGLEKIYEPVLIALINSKSIQRLKNISQMGMPQEYYHKPVFSRYEHSVGVLILLRKLNADLKEQIAGLLHDVSHTAFSHVIDWVFGDPLKEDYQDSTYLNILENSELPDILNKHRVDYRAVSCLKNFSLLEREIPDLCADRFDYTIREFKYWLNPEIVDICVGDLKTYKKQLIFTSEKTAEIFAKNYLRCQNEHWAEEETKARYHILSNILKKGLEDGIISFQDFSKTDREVIQKLKKSKNREVIEYLDLLKGRIFTKEIHEEGVILKKKFRYVDPEIFIRGRIKRLSEVSENYAKILEKEKENSRIEKRIAILR